MDEEGFLWGRAGEEDAASEGLSGLKPEWFWVVGLVIYISGTVMMAAGVNLQKYALNKMKEAAVNAGRQASLPVSALVRNPLWLFGVTCYVSAGICLSTALFFASPALLTPFMSMVLIANVVFAYFLLGETLSKRDLLAIAIVLVGLVMTTVFAPHEEYFLSPSELLDMFFNPAFILFLFVVLSCLGGLFALNRTLYRKVRNAAIPANELESWQLMLFPFSFAALAGGFGGLTVILMKTAIEIIVAEASLGLAHLLTSWVALFLIVIMGGCWSAQMYWLNSGLKFFQAVYIVSLEAVINELIAVVGSIIYFGTTDESFGPGHKTFFVVGLCVGVGGVLLLAYWRKEMSAEEDPFEIDPKKWLDELDPIDGASPSGPPTPYDDDDKL